jgi:hypothetical protein
MNNKARPPSIASPSAIPKTAPTIFPVLLFANVCDAKGVLAAAVLVTETGVVEAGIEVEIVVVAELAEPEVLTPCSAKMVPNVGT